MSDELFIKHEVIFEGVHSTENVVFGFGAVVENLVEMTYGDYYVGVIGTLFEDAVEG